MAALLFHKQTPPPVSVASLPPLDESDAPGARGEHRRVVRLYTMAAQDRPHAPGRTRSQPLRSATSRSLDRHARHAAAADHHARGGPTTPSRSGSSTSRLLSAAGRPSARADERRPSLEVGTASTAGPTLVRPLPEPILSPGRSARASPRASAATAPASPTPSSAHSRCARRRPPLSSRAGNNRRRRTLRLFEEQQGLTARFLLARDAARCARRVRSASSCSPPRAKALAAWSRRAARSRARDPHPATGTIRGRATRRADLPRDGPRRDLVPDDPPVGSACTRACCARPGKRTRRRRRPDGSTRRHRLSWNPRMPHRRAARQIVGDEPTPPPSAAPPPWVRTNMTQARA